MENLGFIYGLTGMTMGIVGFVFGIVAISKIEKLQKKLTELEILVQNKS